MQHLTHDEAVQAVVEQIKRNGSIGGRRLG
jgi:hypothetical protein